MPNVWRARYAWTMSSEIQVPSPSRGACWQPRITASKALSMVTLNRCWFNTLRMLLDTLSCSNGSTARSKGDHHMMGSPSMNQGKTPCS